MGPRSIERGNRPTAKKARAAISSFNGAALDRARKLADGRVESEYRNSLQWGRARSSAEINERRREAADHDLASMGPRSIERGNKPTGDAIYLGDEASMGPRSIE